MSYYHAKHRCKPNECYGVRGIKFLLTREECKELWFRDSAEDMIVPSLDRIDTTGDYSIKNCRFVEISENKRRLKAKSLKRGTSKFKGVHWDTIHQRWLSQVRCGDKVITRHFKNQVDAALEYNKTATLVYGSEAVLNEV